MKINEIVIHNFRSIENAKVTLADFSLIAGQNNAGKTNIITALRAFYENDGFKYQDKRDFPKFETSDSESWIEIEYALSSDEKDTLKQEYLGPDDTLRVRRYFKSTEEGRYDSKQSNLFGYVDGKLSGTLFYGARNIAGARLGTVIYIPELAKPTDTMKLTGPSPLREITHFVFKKIVATSESFAKLNSAVTSFNHEFQAPSVDEIFNLNNLVSDINTELDPWEIDFGFRVNDIKPEDIVKNLLEHFVCDRNLNQQEVNLDSLGQGVQRHIIYTLLRLSAKYVDKKPSKRKEFSPDYTLLLFEEPEAFLHPTQQESLNRSLRALSSETQVLITTHSPVFVSKKVDDLPGIARITKSSGKSAIHQASSTDLATLLDSNIGLYRNMCDLLQDSSVENSVKESIKKKNLGDLNPDYNKRVEEEAFRMFLWLDAERSASFFAQKVLICEGATEKALFDYLIDTRWQSIADQNVYILDAFGKFNIHRFMNLFGSLGIPHSVLYDGDEDRGVQAYINEFLEKNKNSFTNGIDHFSEDLEAELAVKLPKAAHLKPVNVLKKLFDNEIDQDKIEKIRIRLTQLLN